MAWNYAPLWKKLIDKKMKKTDLFEFAKIHPNTLARLSKDEPVSMDALGKLCAAFKCGLDGIVEYVPDDVNVDAE